MLLTFVRKKPVYFCRTAFAPRKADRTFGGILKNTRLLITGALLAALALGAFLLFNWAFGESEPASAPVQPTAALVQTTRPPASAPTVPPAAPSEPGAALTEPAAPSAPVETGTQVYTIHQSDSQARFTIFEELRGQPSDVVGVTDQIAGQFILDPNDLGATQASPIQVNARTLVTDNDMRNRAIRNFILNTDAFEFITFTPTEMRGLSGAGAAGQPFTFQIAGELTIRDITQPVVFAVNAQLAADGLIHGAAAAEVQRSDFNLNIPNVPGVANVGQTVAIAIDFVLEPAG